MNDMDNDWLVTISVNDASELQSICLRSELHALIENDSIHIRIPAKTPDAAELIASFRNLDSSRIQQKQLIPNFGSVPFAMLPGGDWQPLSELFQFETPPAKYSSIQPTSVKIQLKRTSVPRPINLMLCELVRLKEWIDHIAAIRFENLYFAVSNANWTIIKGDRLPDFGTVYFHEQSNVAVQAGYRFDPAIDHEVINQTLAVAKNELLVFTSDDRPVRCSPVEFAKVQRSAVRRSLAEVAESE